MKNWNDFIALSKKNKSDKTKSVKTDKTNSADKLSDSSENATKEIKMKKKTNVSIHSGHRSRMRERFEKDPDLETFAEHEVLELLLYNSVCRKDTNALAHKLINEFGSLENVMDASFDSLRKAGLSEASAAQIKQVLAISNYYLLNKNKKCIFLKSIYEVSGYFGVYFASKNNECVYAALLDANGKILTAINLGRGGPTSTDVDTYKLLSAVSAKGAVRVVLMHNHPAGNLLPSVADLSTTGNIMIQLTIMQATLIDHIVFGSNGNYFSFHQNGLISALTDRCRFFMGNEDRQYVSQSSGLLFDTGSSKGKILNYNSFKQLEDKIVDELEYVDSDDFKIMAKNVKSNPVISNFYKNE